MSKNNIPTHPMNTLKGHTGPVYTAKFNNNGQYCMSGSQDRKIILWNPQKGKAIKSYTGAHNYEINDIQISADNNKFVSAGGDKCAFLWDVKSGKIIRKFGGHTQKLNTVAFNSDESVLATGSYDTQVKLWDLKSHGYQPIQTLKNFKDSITKIIIEEFNIFISSMDGHVYNFDIRMGELDKDNFKVSVHNMNISNDQKSYVASTTDSKLHLVERGTGEILQEFKGHRASQYSIEVQYSWDDQFILTGSEDGYLYIYDFLKGDIVKKVKNHCRAITSLSLNQQRDGIVTGSLDGTITYWTHKTREDQIEYIKQMQFDPEDPQNYNYQNDYL